MPVKSKITISILDDHPMILKGLKQLVGKISFVEEVKEFSTSESFLSYIKNNSPEIAILDMRINGKDLGLDMAKYILNKPKNKTAVIMFTSHTDYYHIVDCLNIGVHGYISKDSNIEEITKAITQIKQGRNYNSPDVQQIIETHVKPKIDLLKNIDENGKPRYISSRELEVLTLTCSGYAEEEMCDKLGISPKTIRKHRQNIMKKLDCNKVHYLYQYAITKGLISF